MKLITQQSHAALVEWRDESNNLQRLIVPLDAMAGITEQELAAGIPFGVPWENLLTARLAERLANRLKEQGIWTYADAANQVSVFRSIVIEIVAAGLLDAARGVH